VRLIRPIALIKQNNNLESGRRIYNMNSELHKLLDDIEIKTKIMCHNDPNISEKLKDWQDGKLPDQYFKEILDVYINELNMGDN
jgi:hypothetical protein